MKNDKLYTIKTSRRRGILFFKLLVAACICGGSLFSCSPKLVPIEYVQIDTVYKVRTNIDTVKAVDSVFIDRDTQKKGDTVVCTITKYKVKERYKTAVKTDTVYKVQKDTVRITEYKEREGITIDKKVTLPTILFALVAILGVLRFYIKRKKQ